MHVLADGSRSVLEAFWMQKAGSKSLKPAKVEEGQISFCLESVKDLPNNGGREHEVTNLSN